MPKVKTHIIKVGTTGNRFWFKPEGWESLVGGFGKVPEDIQKAHDNQEEVEFEYHIFEKDDKKYYNYGPEKKGKATDKTPTGNQEVTNEILKTLVLPKLSVCVEKTVQESQYEPKKISVHISQHVNYVNPDKIRAMIDLAEGEVLGKISEGKLSVSTPIPKPTLTKEHETMVTEAVDKGLSEDIPENAQESIPEAIFREKEKEAKKLN